jgi:HK97 family phage prohead protease
VAKRVTKSAFQKVASIGGLPVAVKFADSAGALEGYASTFGNVDAQNDVVMPGAFAKTLASHRRRDTAPAMLWAHDPSAPIGKWDQLTEDPAGLRVAGKLTLEVARAREAYALAKDGALSLSIGYRTVKSERNAKGERLLKELELLEISLVPIPANPAARITAVKSSLDVSTIRDARAFEEFLRSAGFPRAFAKAVTLRGFAAASADRSAPKSANNAALAAKILAATQMLRKFTKG